MRPTQDIGIETLTDLALDLRWSPRVRELLARPDYRRRVDDLIERRRAQDEGRHET